MIVIGEIVKPQGIKGELKIKPVDSNLKRYKNIKHLFLDSKETSVLSISVRENFIYIKLDGVETRNDAEKLRGKIISVKAEELVPLLENEFYFQDLIGCIIVDEENKFIGELENIEQYGAADILSIRSNNRLCSIPFLDSIIKEINIQQNKIIVFKNEFDEVKICD